MSYLFEFPIYISFLIFVGIGISICLLGCLFIYIFTHYTKNDAHSIPIAAFISTIATAWALSLGFVAADIWSINIKADQAASEERSAISQLLGMASPDILNSRKLSSLLSEYSTVVSQDEWIKYKNTQPLQSVEVVLQKIRGEIVNISKTDIPFPVTLKLMHDFDQLQNARNERLSIGSASVDMSKWYLLFSLTILTTITIVSIHADRKRAAIKAVILYSITASLCIWILTMSASPYQGVGKNKPHHLLFQNERTDDLN